MKRRRRRARSVYEKIVDPAYHAGRRPADPERPTYWAERPRVKEFGTTVTVARLTLQNSYTGYESEAWNVVSFLSISHIKNILGPWEDDIYDSPEEQLVELLEQDHAEGIWQEQAVVKAIRQSGFDSIISQDPFGGETEYVTLTSDAVEIIDVFVCPR